jgi:hypothetical protein
MKQIVMKKEIFILLEFEESVMINWCQSHDFNTKHQKNIKRRYLFAECYQHWITGIGRRLSSQVRQRSAILTVHTENLFERISERRVSCAISDTV